MNNVNRKVWAILKQSFYSESYTIKRGERGSEWMDPTVDFLLVKKTSNPFNPDAFTFGCCCATARSTRRRTCCCCRRPRCRSECFQVYDCVQYIFENMPNRPPNMVQRSEPPIWTVFYAINTEWNEIWGRERERFERSDADMKKFGVLISRQH